MNAVLVYLRDVLGIREYISEIPAIAGTGIRIKTSWITAERAMVDKIISAAGLHGLPTVADETPAAHLIVFDTETPPERVEEGGRVLWNLGPLRALMEGPPDSVQAAKRDVWNLLKAFKEETGL